MPRIKTYSAESGAVYQYYFAAHEPEANGDRYHFSVTEDRHAPTDVAVFVPRASLASWEIQNGRTFTPTERYAIAKMALYAAWDRGEGPLLSKHPVEVTASEVHRIAELLDL